MYSIVMLAAMTAAPETPDFCFLKNKHQSNGCGGCYGQQQQFCGSGNGGGGKCCFLGCGLFSRCFGGICGNGCCNFLGCGLFSKCCGNYQPGGGYGNGYGAYGQGSIYMGFNNSPRNDSAEVIVNLPANAKLISNGQAIEGTGKQRVFQTPALNPGQDYRYEMKVEIEDRSGRTRTLNKQVTVRAGHRTTVEFNERVTTKVIVSLPPSTKMYVDGVDSRMTGGKHEFTTPELVKGEPFTYTFRAEIDRDGKMEVVTQEVSFKAGELVNVDFTKKTTASTK